MPEQLDKAELLAASYTTDELLQALGFRLKYLAEHYRKIPNERYMTFSHEASIGDLVYFCGTGRDIKQAFRSRVFDAFTNNVKDYLEKIVHVEEYTLPIGETRTYDVMRGTICFIKPDPKLQFGGM